MFAQRLFPIIASFLVALLLTSCKDNPSSPAEQNPLIGAWLMESMDGESALEIGATWLFTANTASYAQAVDACRGELAYTLSGNKMFVTITAQGCDGVPVGTRDTATFKVTGDRLTLTLSDGTTAVLRRLTGNDRVMGTWKVLKVDGEAPQAGVEVRLFLNDRVFVMETHTPVGDCVTAFQYLNDGSRLSIAVILDECSELPPGTEDVVSWTESNNKLTLVFSDGTKMEATRL